MNLAERAMRATAFQYCEDLFWRVDDDVLTIYVDCSDAFAWGSADLEELTEDNIDLFEQVYAECEAKVGWGRAYYARFIFASRVRNQKLMPERINQMVSRNPLWKELLDV